MKMVWGILGAILIGGSFFGLGYLIFSGNQLTEHTMTYGGIDPVTVQDWIIAQLGQSLTGLIFMVVGVYAALWSLIPDRTTLMLKISGLVSLGLAGLIIYYGYNTYHGIPIELDGDLHGRKQGLQRVFVNVIESVQDSLGAKQAGMLFMGLGGLWGLLSLFAGLIKRPAADQDID